MAAGALTSLARLLPALHAADWQGREQLVSSLADVLLEASAAHCEGGVLLCVAAAEAAGYVGVQLLQQAADGLLGSSGGGGDAALSLGCSCLGLALAGLRGAGGAAGVRCVERVMAALPHSLRGLLLLPELRFSQVGRQHGTWRALLLAVSGDFAWRRSARPADTGELVWYVCPACAGCLSARRTPAARSWSPTC